MNIVEIISTKNISETKTGGEKYSCELISRLEQVEYIKLYTISLSDLFKKNNSAIVRMIRFSDSIKLFVFSHYLQMVLGKKIVKKVGKKIPSDIDLIVSQHETPLYGVLAIELGKKLNVPVLIKHQLPLSMGTISIQYESIISATFKLQRFMFASRPILKKAPVLLALVFQDIIHSFVLEKYYGYVNAPNVTNVTVSRGLSQVLRKFFEIDVISTGPLVAISHFKDSPNDRFRITFFTRISYSKGAHLVPYIFKELENLNKDFKPVFTVMGNINDNLSEDILKTAKKLKLPIEVYFNASQDQKLSVLRESLCIIHPSFHDATPLSVLEALSVGTPVVMWDLPYSLEFDTIAVEKAKFSDIHDFALKTIKQAKNVAELKNDAVSFASKYNWNNVVENEIKLYKSILIKGENNAKNK